MEQVVLLVDVALWGGMIAVNRVSHQVHSHAMTQILVNYPTRISGFTIERNLSHLFTNKFSGHLIMLLNGT